MSDRRRWLLLFAPLLLAGCGGLGGSSPTGTPSPVATTGNGNGSGSWLVVAHGSPTPTPRPSSGIPPYPISTATGFLPVAPTTGPTPTPTCAPDTVHFSRIGALDVTPGTTSATATWYNVGGYNLVEYRLTAISQDLRTGKQRDIGWVTIKPKKACGPLSATISKLDRKTGYVFSLDAVVTRRSGAGTHAGTLMRSHVIYTK
ncbi:hypothetical protein AB0J80_15940 [Actinoplanes sp. NPDC049548]|uniref:hypothetical protein n=1 Tax=Actinoplanes sp. NPDC049548 TaxID=3155152 RepID=UPI00343CC7C2